MNKQDILTIAKEVVETEIQGLKDLKESLDQNILEVVKQINHKETRLIFSGMGKSGYVARKISSSMSSSGTPSFFIHPAEASHGDLGMISKNDIVVLLSNSGDTMELNSIIEYCKRFNIFIVGISRNNNSLLSKIANLSIVLPQSKEASEINMPTTSVIMMIAFWDAVAVVLQKIRNFSKEDFRVLHPGGKIGAKLLKISDLMHRNNFIPLVKDTERVADAVIEMTKKGFGCTGVISKNSELIGIITDGDLRRHLELDMRRTLVYEIMNYKPLTMPKDAFASEALAIMNQKKITQIFIIKNQSPVGILHMHDLIRSGII